MSNHLEPVQDLKVNYRNDLAVICLLYTNFQNYETKYLLLLLVVEITYCITEGKSWGKSQVVVRSFQGLLQTIVPISHQVKFQKEPLM